ncbi:CAP domain-containing protein [Paenibacillus sp. UNC217MF]|nr:CAP domain-containing protein [Paenibacillus sp. UNC217MF]
MHFGQKSSTMAMQGWLDTAYHRDIILGSAYNEIGSRLLMEQLL